MQYLDYKTKTTKSNNENSKIIEKLYNICSGLFYCSTSAPGSLVGETQISYRTLQKWTCMTFYDVKQYLELLVKYKFIWIKYTDPTDPIRHSEIEKIYLRTKLYKFLGTRGDLKGHRNLEIVKKRIKEGKDCHGVQKRFLLFYLAGRCGQKHSSFKNGPVTVIDIVNFLSKQLAFEKITENDCSEEILRLKKRKMSPKEFDSTEKSIRESLRQMGHADVVLSDIVPSEEQHYRFKKHEEEEDERKNRKHYILNLDNDSCALKSIILEESSNEDPSKDIDLSPMEKNLKKKKEKKEKKPVNFEKIGTRKIAQILFHLNKDNFSDFLSYCLTLNPNRSKIFDRFGGALHNFTKRLCKKLEEKCHFMKFFKPKFAILKKLWSSLKAKKEEFFDLVLALTEEMRRPSGKNTWQWMEVQNEDLKMKIEYGCRDSHKQYLEKEIKANEKQIRWKKVQDAFNAMNVVFSKPKIAIEEKKEKKVLLVRDVPRISEKVAIIDGKTNELTFQDKTQMKEAKPLIRHLTRQEMEEIESKYPKWEKPQEKERKKPAWDPFQEDSDELEKNFNSFLNFWCFEKE
jgi:hypothetical protein